MVLYLPLTTRGALISPRAARDFADAKLGAYE
jgi:hypothetical protein